MGEQLFATAIVQEIAVIAGGVGFLTALSLGAIFTSWMCRLSWRAGVVDRPDDCLKRHEHPTATLGGIPLYFAVSLGVFLVLWQLGYALKGEISPTDQSGRFVQGMLFSGLIILLMGICDDLHQIKPRTKALFQVIAAMILISSGLVINQCDFFGIFHISFGILSIPFTLFWLVGCCNAFNFIDGIDGLASGIGMIVAAVLAVLGFINGAYIEAVIALTMAGGLLGILLFNFQPAKIFLGDSGSQLIGLVLGALTVKITTTNGMFALPCAGLILSIPILDTFLSVLRRYSTSESMSQGDHRHVHHRLCHYGLSVRQVALILWLAALIVGVYGIVFYYAVGISSGLTALSLVGLELYLGIRLGCLDPGKLLARLGISNRWTQRAGRSASHQMADFENLWDRMKPLFEKMNLDRVVLTLECVNSEGQPKYETYRWVRSEEKIAELLANRWTKRFSLGDDEIKIATLQLESDERLSKDEHRINMLLQQISKNMQNAGQDRKRGEIPGKTLLISQAEPALPDWDA